MFIQQNVHICEDLGLRWLEYKNLWGMALTLKKLVP
jgi:hypothetical protein